MTEGETSESAGLSRKGLNGSCNGKAQRVPASSTARVQLPTSMLTYWLCLPFCPFALQQAHGNMATGSPFPVLPLRTKEAIFPRSSGKSLRADTHGPCSGHTTHFWSPGVYFCRDKPCDLRKGEGRVPEGAQGFSRGRKRMPGAQEPTR